MNLQDRIARFLTEGMKKKEIPSKSSKYRTFTGRDEGHFYFVGKSGAVRSGKNSSTSISITSAAQGNMKLWEKKEGK